MSAAAEFELALRFEHPEIDIRCETLGDGRLIVRIEPGHLIALPRYFPWNSGRTDI
jgi:hypothetical protein